MKKLLLLLLSLLALDCATAQPPMGPPPGMMPPGMMPPGEGRQRKTPAERIAHIVKELELTAEQAEKFAPVYLAYQTDVRNIRKDLKMVMDSYKDQEINEKVAFKLIMAQLNADADIIACKKEHARVFKDYLNPEQLSRIFLVEKQRPQRPPHPPKGLPDGVPAPPQDAPAQ